MKFPTALALSGLALAVVSHAGQQRDASNPVGRVVELLKGLQEKLESELKEETQLFKRYECWYKSVLAAKAASNTDANARIDSLVSYIADIDAGKITFTTEQADLQKQIAALTTDLAQAEALRTQEEGDFEAAKAEMEQAKAALADAIKVMKAGTAASLLSKTARTTNSMLDLRERLQKAIVFGRQVLSSADATKLARMLNNDVPEWDWKKLNRKATFKSKYKARSGSILETLDDLEKTFTANLADAIQNEADAVKAYGKLKASKEGMLSTAQKSLVDMVEENGARGLSKSDAAAEVVDLRKQVAADTEFSRQVEAAYLVKITEWAARKQLRDNEILSCSKAIAVLHSDDARDLFKDSFKSQGYTLLQESARKCGDVRRRVLLQLAKVVKGVSAASLVDAARQGSIALVITKVDQLIASLEAEEATDLTQKETCEQDLATNAQDARMASLSIDDYTEAIERANNKAIQIQTQIEEEQANVITTQDELKTATDQRSDETTKYAADKLQDQGAVQLLQMALDVMSKFKQGGGAAAPTFLQLSNEIPASRKAAGLVAIRQHVVSQHDANQPIEVAAGLAPPPPPATWEDPTYAGAEGESVGILSIIQLIKADVEQDIAAADKTEADAQAAFDKQEISLNAAIKAANDAISVYQGDKAAQEQEAIDKGTERTSKKAALDGSINLYQGLRPGCDYIGVNYAARRVKRQVEIDGLIEAKAILQGTDFPALIQANGSLIC